MKSKRRKRKKHRFHVKIKLIKKSGSYAMLEQAEKKKEFYAMIRNKVKLLCDVQFTDYFLFAQSINYIHI